MGMDLGSGKGKKGRAAPEMNVTPLVDVVLVLLIIFMVIAPSLKAMFWVHVPDRPDPNAPPPPPGAIEPIVVSVRADGRIRINQQILTDRAFPAHLHRVLAARGERKIFFDASNDAPYGRAVEVLDMARRGGAAHIAVATEHLN
jgi:biopolymer transport protein TolR